MESFNHFSAIAQEFDRLQAKAVRKTAFDLEAATKAQMRTNGQIDTGFMWNSAYVRTSDETTYGDALRKKTAVSDTPTKTGKVRKLNKRQRALLAKNDDFLEEVEAPPDNKTAYMAMAASYASFQNYGTHTMPARPFLEPAIEVVRPKFERALAAIENKLQAVK